VDRVFQRSFKPIHYQTTGHTRGTFGGRKYHHCSWSPPGCLNTEGCDEIRPEVVSVKWPGFLERNRKVGKLGWSSPCTSKETRVNAPTNGASLSVASLKKYSTYKKSTVHISQNLALKKDAVKQLNHNQCGFHYKNW